MTDVAHGAALVADVTTIHLQSLEGHGMHGIMVLMTDIDASGRHLFAQQEER